MLDQDASTALKELSQLVPDGSLNLDQYQGICAYIRFKLKFLKYYELNQHNIFSAYPLQKYIVTQTLSATSIEFNPLLRIRALSKTSGGKEAHGWIKVITNIDPIRNTFLPLGHKTRTLPPIHFTTIFHSFLEAEIFKFSLGPIPNRIRSYGILPSVVNGKVGPQGATLISAQWNDIEKNAKNILNHYFKSEIKINSTTHKEFTSMTIFTHVMVICVNNLMRSLSHSIPTSNSVLVDLLSWLKICLYMWPKFIAGILRSDNLHQSFIILNSVLPTLIDSIKHNTLEDFLNNRPRSQSMLPDTEAILFFHPTIQQLML